MSEEKRQFQRVPFHNEAQLIGPKGYVDIFLLDLSMKGALTTKPINSDWEIFEQMPFSLKIPLDEGHIIAMEVTVAHVGDDCLGFYCQNVDIDSITHIKRLIELNLCDSDMLQRDLEALIKL